MGIYKEVIRKSFPVLLSFLSFHLLGVTDMLMVSKLGTEAIVGVGLALTLFYFLSLPLEGLFESAVILMSKSFGQKDYRKLRRYLKHELAIAAVIGVVGVFLFFPLSLVFPLVSNSPEVCSMGRIYLLISLIGFAPHLLNLVLMRFLLSIHRNRSIALISNSMVVLNVFLCYCLIFGKFGFPALGVAGSAIATVVSKIVGLAAFFIVMRYYKKKDMPETKSEPFSLKHFVVIFKTGFPLFQTNFAEISAWTIFVGIISRIGSDAYAAHEIGMKIKDVAFLPGFAIGMVCTAFAGKCIGARDAVKGYAYTAAARNLSVVMMGFCGAVFLLFPNVLAGFFSKSPAVLENARHVLIVMALYQISDALFIVYRASLIGVNDTKFIRNAITIGAWCIMIPVALVAVKFFNAGVAGAWIGLTVYVTVISIVMMRRFYSKNWFSGGRRVAEKTK